MKKSFFILLLFCALSPSVYADFPVTIYSTSRGSASSPDGLCAAWSDLWPTIVYSSGITTLSGGVGWNGIGCYTPDGGFRIRIFATSTCSDGSAPDISKSLADQCTPAAPCPVAPLTPITDPVALEYENGIYDDAPDLERLKPAVRQGMACIQQKVAALGHIAEPSSGYRPPAYQTHFWEIYSKWKLLKNNNDPACKAVKDSVMKEMRRHHILVTYPTSPHSSGNAVDIKGVPASQADAIASQCNMYRPLPQKDPVHYLAR